MTFSWLYSRLVACQPNVKEPTLNERFSGRRVDMAGLVYGIQAAQELLA